MNNMTRSHVYLPYPEFVEPAPVDAPYLIWNSLEEDLPTSGMVNLLRREMWVPLEWGGRAVTRHELAHVAWSPARPTRVRFDERVLAALEDARINLGLAGIGLPVDLDAESYAHVMMLLAQDAKRDDGFALFMRSIASLGTSVEEGLESQLLGMPGPLGPVVVAWMARARSELEAARHAARGPVAPYKKAVDLARALARELRALGLLDRRDRSGSTVRVNCWVHGHGRGQLKDPRGRRGRPGRGDYAEDERGEVEPGRMHIKEVPLSVALRPGRGGLAWRAATEGSVVRYLSRWPIDGAVFRRRSRCGGGTVLVDMSGSMSLDASDLDRLLLATPQGARVAIYSGSGEVGELRIVANGGRRAAARHLERYGNGNIVDLPALEWLARQPLPRLLVSDGAATGVHDRGSLALRRRCEAVCRRARIRRVEKLDEAATLLKSGGVAASLEAAE
jgi:hypothetical protein